MDELKATLLKNPVLAALEAEDLEHLLAPLSVTDHEAGHVFFKEGQHADGAYLVLSGEVAVTRRGLAGEEVNRIGSGGWFGIVALLDDKRRSATCSAATHARVAWLSASAFQLLMQSATPAALALQKVVAAQLCDDFRNMQAALRAALEK